MSNLQTQVVQVFNKTSTVIVNQILTKLKQRISKLEELKIQYQQHINYFHTNEAKFKSSIQKIKLNNSIINKSLINLKYLSKRIDFQNYPYLEIDQNIYKLTNLLSKYSTIGTKIQFSHIANFKQLNNTYLDLVFTKPQNNILLKHENFLKKFKQDSDKFSNPQCLIQLQDHISQILNQEDAYRQSLRSEFKQKLEQIKRRIVGQSIIQKLVQTQNYVPQQIQQTVVQQQLNSIPNQQSSNQNKVEKQQNLQINEANKKEIQKQSCMEIQNTNQMVLLKQQQAQVVQTLINQQILKEQFKLKQQVEKKQQQRIHFEISNQDPQQ